MKTGRKSRAELATPAVYRLPTNDRLQPPADLGEDARKIFIDIVLANEATAFRASDMPLLTAYCRAIVQEQTASAHLEAEGHVIDGKPSPWLAVLGQSQKALVAFAHRLKLSPQSRSPSNPTRQKPLSYFERMQLEGQSE